MTDALRLEVAPWGIRVAVVEPGAVATPLWHRGAAAAQGFYAGVPEGKRVPKPARRREGRWSAVAAGRPLRAAACAPA